MTPAPFGYVRPRELDEAVAILAGDPGAQPLAGGQSLLPLMVLRHVRPSQLVDLTAIDGLDTVAWDAHEVRIGACTRQRALERDPEVPRRLPLAAAALREMGRPQTRARGTVGGSIAHLDPRAELVTLGLILAAQVELRGPMGARRVAFGEIALGPSRLDLGPGELITTVILPIPAPGARTCFHEIARRPNDRALALAAGVVDGSGVRVVAGGMDGLPQRLESLERSLGAGLVRPADARDAAAAALRSLPFADDPIEGPAEHRRAIAEACLARVVAGLVA